MRCLKFSMSLAVVFMLASFTLSANNLPDFTGMVEKYSPAVVNISTSKNITIHGKKINPHDFGLPEMDPDNPFNDFLEKFLGEHFNLPDLIERDSKSLGSGFIISADGYILTNHHVVANADEILVTLKDKREFKAELIGSDKGTDTALVKIDSANLPTVNLGKAADLKVGEWVLAIGSPFGFEHSVTAGIVSAKGRSLPSENYVPFIQTDVAINPGNSGGPLFNLKGEVVGVNSQIFSRSGGFMGLSFAIPIELATNVAEQLKSHGEVRRGYLGVFIQDVTHELAESFHMKRPRGALISKIIEGSPADQADLQVGDIILKFNGQIIERSSQLPPLVGSSPLGKPATVEIIRNGKRLEYQLNVQQLPDSNKVAGQSDTKSEFRDRVGLVVKNISKTQREQLGLDMKEGVLVTDVKAGAARLAGVKVGDIITRINNRSIESTADYDDVMGRAEPGRNVALLIHRDEKALFIPIRIPLQ